MSNKSQSPKFAEITPTGIVALILGIGAITLLFRNLLVACLVGVIGIVVGITTLRMQAEKQDKIFAVIGIIFSLVPIIYAIYSFA